MLTLQKTLNDETGTLPSHHEFDLDVIYEGAVEANPFHRPALSTRGMFIETTDQFPVESILNLRIRLINAGLEVNVRARVRHSVPDVGFGVRFIDLSPRALSAIEEELRSTSAWTIRPGFRDARFPAGI